MNNVYWGDFDSKEDVEGSFGVKLNNNEEILYATYNLEGYEGSAHVIFAREDKLFEVNGSHCSCYGLENQWDEEEVEPIEILYRIENGRANDADIIKEAIQKWQYAEEDFDNLLTPFELYQKLNFTTILEETQPISESQIKDIKANIITGIKNAVANNNGKFFTKQKLNIDEKLTPFINDQKELIEQKIKAQFEVISKKLSSKDWKNNFQIENGYISFDIDIPVFGEKPTRVKRSRKS